MRDSTANSANCRHRIYFRVPYLLAHLFCSFRSWLRSVPRCTFWHPSRESKGEKQQGEESVREVDGRQQKKNGGMLLQIEVPSPGFAGRGLNRLSCVSLPRPPFLVARAHTQAQVNDLHPNEKTQPPEKKKPSEEHTIPEPASRVRHSFRCPQENEEVNCKPRVLRNNKLNKKETEKKLSSVHAAINPLIPAARDIASLKLYAQM